MTNHKISITMKTKKHLQTLIALAFLSLVGGHVFAQDLTDIENKIKKINKEVAQQMVKGDFSTDYYSDDAISMPNNAPMMEIKASTEQMKASGFKFESFTATPVKIMLNGNMVTEIGTYSLSMNVPNMSSPITDKGKYLTLWEIQDDGSLKIKAEIWNTDTMPQQ